MSLRLSRKQGRSRAKSWRRSSAERRTSGGIRSSSSRRGAARERRLFWLGRSEAGKPYYVHCEAFRKGKESMAYIPVDYGAFDREIFNEEPFLSTHEARFDFGRRFLPVFSMVSGVLTCLVYSYAVNLQLERSRNNLWGRFSGSLAAVPGCVSPSQLETGQGLWSSGQVFQHQELCDRSTPKSSRCPAIPAYATATATL